jgi:hypothetical protein
MLFCLFARFPITRGHAQTAKGHPTITANETAAFGERNAMQRLLLQILLLQRLLLQLVRRRCTP